jgi:hypothetical protein
MQFDVSLDNPSAGISYSWVVTGSGAKLKFGANTNHPILFMQTTGTFSITGTVTNSCGSSNYSAIDLNSETYYFLYCGSFFVSVFPNPAKSNMTLSLSKPTKENDIVSVKLYSQRNTQVIRQWRFKGEQKQFNLNIKDVRKGIYILEVMINGKKDAKTIVVN